MITCLPALSVKSQIRNTLSARQSHVCRLAPASILQACRSSPSPRPSATCASCSRATSSSATSGSPARSPAPAASPPATPTSRSRTRRPNCAASCSAPLCSACRAADYLAQGSQVIVHGRLTVYEARGELQVVVDFVQPEGVGLRHAQFERLRRQLEEEGLFEESRKRPLPPFPRASASSPLPPVPYSTTSATSWQRWPLSEESSYRRPRPGPNTMSASSAASRRSTASRTST